MDGRGDWRVRGVVFAVFAGMFCALASGCGTARPAALKLEVLATRPATEPLDLAAVYGTAGPKGHRPDARATEHAEAKGDAATGAETATEYLENRGVVRVECERRAGEIIERRVLLADDEPTLLIESHYRVNEAGELVLVEEFNHEEDVEVVFDPPLLVFPPTLAPGERLEQNLTMTVHPLGDRSRVRARGPVKASITYEGHERIVIPAGEFDAAKVTAVFEAVLNIARVMNTTEKWIADTGGTPVPLEGKSDTGGTPVPLEPLEGTPWMLAERREEITRVLLPSTKRRLLVLLDKCTVNSANDPDAPARDGPTHTAQ
jgi:hypothetical protein